MGPVFFSFFLTIIPFPFWISLDYTIEWRWKTRHSLDFASHGGRSFTRGSETFDVYPGLHFRASHNLCSDAIPRSSRTLLLSPAGRYYSVHQQGSGWIDPDWHTPYMIHDCTRKQS